MGLLWVVVVGCCGLLLLWVLLVGCFGRDIPTCVCPHVEEPENAGLDKPLNSCNDRRPDSWEFNSRRQRHPHSLDDEELFIIEGSPTANTGAQLRDNPEEREKWPKKTEKPIHRTQLRKATCLCCEL